MARAKDILFRIFYSTSYTFVFFITSAFICASPADTLYQSYRRRRLIDIAFIAGAYVITGLFAILIYASRLYTNRSIINAIPKTYMPIDEDELPRKRIWHYISDTLLKSAVVAYQVKPRSARIENEIPEAMDKILAALHPEDGKDEKVTCFEPRWGPIEHRGWSSPAKDELPNLEYATVVAELVDLIEAKAVSLASTNSGLPPAENRMFVPDDEIVHVLARPETSGMRQYITQLTNYGIIRNTSLAAAFLNQYERARFAPQPLSEDDFQSLMRMFAELLRSMSAFEFSTPATHNRQVDEGGSRTDSTSEDELSMPRSTIPDNHISHGPEIPPARVSEDSVPSQDTDESSDQSVVHSAVPTRSRAKNRQNSRNASAMQPRVMLTRPSLPHQHSQTSLLSSRSNQSSRSGRSGRSITSNTGSVIVRLHNDDGEQSLPYAIEVAPHARPASH